MLGWSKDQAEKPHSVIPRRSAVSANVKERPFPVDLSASPLKTATIITAVLVETSAVRVRTVHSENATVRILPSRHVRLGAPTPKQILKTVVLAEYHAPLESASRGYASVLLGRQDAAQFYFGFILWLCQDARTSSVM
jgi:hypothetical protein